MTILYLTQDGITDHIGQAQVAPYLIGLARLGHDIHIISAEKPGRDALNAQYRDMFAAVGIRWTTIGYHNSPPLVSTAWDLTAMWRAGRRIAARETITAIHCRSHPPMFVAMALKRSTGARLLFDFRDFWADSGLVKGRFKPVYRWFKRRERDFVAAADQMVCLTQRAADHLAAIYPDRDRPAADKYTVIPCCADFDLFMPSPLAKARRAELEIPADAVVLLYLGSIGPYYLLSEMMALFAELRLLRPGACFVLLCNNGAEEIAAAAARYGIPAGAMRVLNAARGDVPSYISMADLSVVFIRADLSKLGCSPTKLGELFACNVPVVANSGFGDIDAIVDAKRNGSAIVHDFAPETLRAALITVLDAKPIARDIRSESMEFSLETGIERYAAVYRSLIQGGPLLEMPRDRPRDQAPPC